MRRLTTLLSALAVAGLVAACGATTGPSVASRPATVAGTAADQTTDAVTHNPGIKHIFVIVIENEPYANTYTHNPNPYLGKTLQAQGTLLTHYYGIGHYSLDNYIAMISGQAPNPTTSADCGRYSPFVPDSTPMKLDSNGQAVGTGCIFPSKVKTIADQLDANHVSWGGFMDQMGATKGREQARCGVPTLTSAGVDDTQKATAPDQYAARHNPFVYFKSLVDSGSCKKHVVPLTDLTKALKHTKTTPDFSFITPDLCDDGHDHPCVGQDASGSSTGGLTSVDHFLKQRVPTIRHSPAFKKNGLLIITSDESEGSDASSCCNEQPGPTDANPGIVGPGGGRIGTLVLGTCVKAGAKDPTPYNHYSLLRSLEDLYGITKGGSDGKGHLGFAGAAGLRPFGSDLFRTC